MVLRHAQTSLFWFIAAVVSMAMCLSVSFTFLSTSAEEFPKTANYFLKWSMTAAEMEELSKWDVLVLDMEQQIQNPQYLKELRKRNPDIILLAYITPQEIRTDAVGGYSQMRDRLARGISAQWYLVDDKKTSYSFWPGTVMLNVTNHAPLIGGQRFNEYLSTFVADEIIDTGLWDGVFYDNAWSDATWFTGNKVDYNRDGKADTDIDKKWYAGMNSLYEMTREKTPKGTIIVGNGHTKGYTESLNGKMIENFQIHGWNDIMKVYAQNQAAEHKPRVNIVNGNTGNKNTPTAYRSMRYGLASTLLVGDDGYYSFDYGAQDHGQTWWYDEYDVDLGEPVGSATSPTGQTSFATGVWQREFAQGIAVVNSGKSSSKVTLPGEYEKIRGTQDKTVNDGAIVSSVTVPAQDGLLLMKTIQRLDNIIYTNGDFARFFKHSGDRVRNGFFLYDSIAPGGAQVGRIDIDGDDKLDSVVVTKNRITVRRNNGKLLARFRPYGVSFSSGIRIAFGDIDGDNKKEMIVAPGAKNLPVRIYDYTGSKVGEDWYPFGKSYADGYSVALSQQSDDARVAIGSSKGSVSVFDPQTRKQVGTSWKAFGGNSVPYVAMGNIDTSAEEEIVVGAGKGGGANVKVFSVSGKVQSEFVAYTTIVSPGLPVQLADVDSNGVLDIVTLSSGF